MRQKVTISLSPYMYQKLKRTVVDEGFSNMSEFFRHLLRFWAATRSDRIIRQEQVTKNLRELQRKISHERTKEIETDLILQNPRKYFEDMLD